MAGDIVPIQLSLTGGDLVTLWAPQWREDGEEWEAFLGDADAVFGFPTVAHLAAFVRTARRHDLHDHPAWSVVPQLTVTELIPEDTHRYDVIGVPALAAERPDTWTVGELAEITGIVRSLADVCDLAAVHEVLGSATGFSLLDQGSLPFSGREGTRVWDELCTVVAERWDEVIETLDALVRTPEVDPDALAGAQDEPAAAPNTAEEPRRAADDGPGAFWAEVGIDPVRITTADGEYYTLRCYLDDRPVFLGRGGMIDLFRTPRALTRHLAAGGAAGDLAAASTWPEVVAAAADGDLAVEVDEQNDYVLLGIDLDLAEGPLAVDPEQLDLAVELLRDVGHWAGDREPAEALAESESLGWLVSFVIRPEPTRLAPSPPFEAEAARWRELVDDLTRRLTVH